MYCTSSGRNGTRGRARFPVQRSNQLPSSVTTDSSCRTSWSERCTGSHGLGLDSCQRTYKLHFSQLSLVIGVINEYKFYTR